MLNRIILASKSKVRKEILDKHNIFCEVKPSYVDEDVVKESLMGESASPEVISKDTSSRAFTPGKAFDMPFIINWSI